jgi:ribosomal protein S18 acetylase RimI-like enzyme
LKNLDQTSRGGEFLAADPERSRTPSGLRGHVFNVATDVDRRHRGYARRCLESVLDWFRAATPVGRVELHASTQGFELYRSLGFELPREPAMQLTISR